MARTFGSYSPAVPLAVNWEESIILEDENGAAIDLTGYDVRAQFRTEIPEVDPLTGLPLTDPVFELTSVGWYVVDPAWPVFEVLSIPTPDDGTILSNLEVEDLWTASPDNTKRRLFWSIILVNPSTLYAIPVVVGRVTFKPATTI